MAKDMKYALIALGVLVILMILYLAALDTNPKAGANHVMISNTSEMPAGTPENTEPQAGADMNKNSAETDNSEQAAMLAYVDIKSALDIRALGSPDAPVKIYEYASLTCGHCAAFHKETFKALKEEFIDTGKVYLVAYDFPLNKPALDAAMVARCLPKDRYFDFIQLLFETQDDWAYNAGYFKYLQQNAQLLGLSAGEFESCINSKPLQIGISTWMEEAKTKYQVNSTPSFVLNETTKISGNTGIKDFRKAIEAELAKTTTK